MALPGTIAGGTVAMVLLGARLSTIFPSEVTQFAEAGLIFGRTTIKPSKVTFTGPYSAAFSARPISKSHTVVTTRRRVTRSAELSSDEYLDLWRTVAAARDAAMSARGAVATNLLLKDGVGCGAAVPHLHVHIVPRVPDDFFPNDKVFSAIEGWAPSLKDELARPEVIPMDIPNDADRKDRTFEMMAMEAGAYRAIMGGSTPDHDHTFGRFPIDKRHIFAQSKGEGRGADCVGNHTPACRWLVCTSARRALTESPVLRPTRAGGKTVAFVNLRPLVPGHVLVTPRRLVART